MKKKIIYGLFTIVFCVILTGCENNNTNINNEENNPNPKQEETEIVTDVDDYEIKEEEGKVIINLDDTTTQVYYHDGEKVIDFESYKLYKNHKEAEEMYDTLKAYGTAFEDETLDSLEVKGKYLVYNYNEKGFNGITTYEELKNYAQKYNVLLDNNEKNDENNQIE